MDSTDVRTSGGKVSTTRTAQRTTRRSLIGGAAATSAILALGGPRLIAAQPATPAAATTASATSAIFIMGDGMGQAHRDAGQLFSVGAYDRLVMDTLPVIGLVGTNSVSTDELVTDSAAAATAFATGVKTLNGAGGVDANGQNVTNIVELAKAAGKSVGLVTTSQVSDASPACFAAHVADRDDQSEIARQYIEDAQVDVILGGGEDRWLPEGSAGAYPDNPAEDPEEQSESDKGDLIARAQELGYAYVSDSAGLESAAGPKLLGLFANEEMFQQFPEGEGDSYDPVVTLEQMVTKAIEILSQNPNGFFLFVEEEAIDEMAHANNASLTLKGVEELDKAVAVALDYATANPDTLLLVTADHECGGPTMEGPDNPEYPDESGTGTDDNAGLSGEDGPFPVAGSGYVFKMDWTTTGHTGTRVPLTAVGPGSDALAGDYENTVVFVAIVQALGLELPQGVPATPTPGIPAGSATPAASPVS